MTTVDGSAENVRSTRSATRHSVRCVRDWCCGIVVSYVRMGRPAFFAGTALANVNWAYVDSVPDDAGPWSMPDVDEDAIAVIQYTSRSIAAPNAVLVTNRNILANSEIIRNAHGNDGRPTIVSWGPLARAWGLIGSIVQPAYGGGQSVLMSPETFLKQPVQWLRAIARYQDGSNGDPNFACDLCRRKVGPDDPAVYLAATSLLLVSALVAARLPRRARGPDIHAAGRVTNRSRTWWHHSRCGSPQPRGLLRGADTGHVAISVRRRLRRGTDPFCEHAGVRSIGH